MKILKITKIITERSTADKESARDESGIMPHMRLNDFACIDEDGYFCSIQILKKMSEENVREKLNCLTNREREVMQMLIGYGCASMSVNEVADHFEVLPSRIRQIRDKALKKINSPKN